jgi:hypothetical protein
MTSPSKLLWLVLLLCGLGVAATKPIQSPKGAEQVVPQRVKLAVVVPPAKYRDIPWHIASYTNVWWNLQVKTASGWSTVQSNVTGNVIVTNSKPMELFRLEGRTNP